MVSAHELTRLDLADKRRIMSALLRSTFDAPRSLPLSYAQQQLWFMDQLQPGSAVYNIPLYVPFPGALDADALQRALETLTQRHDMLRARFAAGDDEPVQIVEPEVEVDLPLADLSRVPAGERRAALSRLLNDEVQAPFDLASGVCVRYKLIRLDPGDHVLSVTMHHIITDAWSLGVFVSELRTVYEAYRGGRQSAPLAPLQLEYSDYARWQRATLRGLRLNKLVAYWKGQLAGAPPVLHLPTDHPRPLDQTFNGTLAGFVFDDELSAALIALARRYHVTLFMLLLACYYTLLYRYTGQDDIIVGAPVAGRQHTELEPIIGIFINTLILRAELQDSHTFEDVVKKVQRTTLDAFEHQALPFPKLVDELNVERVPGYPPLYQVVFNFQNASLIESSDPFAEGESLVRDGFPLVHSNTSKVDLNLTITQRDAGISGGVEYNTDLFDPGTIDAMIAHLEVIAETVVSDPSIPLMDIPLTAAVHDAAVRERGPVEGGRFSFELSD